MKILRVVLIMSVFACANGDTVARDRQSTVLFQGPGMIIFAPANGSAYEYGELIGVFENRIFANDVSDDFATCMIPRPMRGD